MPGSRPIWIRLGLDLVTLRVFVAAAEESSFARAADREGIALSAVSRRIATLEARSGVLLFNRHDRGVTLTAAGETLEKQLRDLFNLLDRVAVDLEATRGGDKGHVRLQAHMSATSGPLPTQLAQFLEAHPGVNVYLEERTSIDILHAVQTGMADIGLVSGTLPTGDLHLIPWMQDELVAIIPRGHALASKRRLTLADLVDQPFIGMQRDSALLRLYREHAQSLGRQLRERAHATSFESVRRLVSNGLGVAILPAVAVQPFKRALRIESRPLAESWARRPLMICVRSPSRLSASAKSLIQFLLESSSSTSRH